MHKIARDFKATILNEVVFKSPATGHQTYSAVHSDGIIRQKGSGDPYENGYLGRENGG